MMATAAAYDLRKAGAKVELPLFWHYRAIALETDGNGQRTFCWPLDKAEGRKCVHGFVPTPATLSGALRAEADSPWARAATRAAGT